MSFIEYDGRISLICALDAVKVIFQSSGSFTPRVNIRVGAWNGPRSHFQVSLQASLRLKIRIKNLWYPFLASTVTLTVGVNGLELETLDFHHIEKHRKKFEVIHN